MPPIRNAKGGINPNAIPIEIPIPGSSKPSTTAGHKGANVATNSKKKFRHKPAQDLKDEEPKALGVSKIKAAIRQTTRLLAKDTLSADTRTETERRLKSLKLDLEKAEGRNVERKNAERYHKIKFFEKKKLTRRLKQLQKSLPANETEGSPSKELKKIEKEIEALRVGLNYVLNYPNTQKYISLFPPTTREESSESSTSTLQLTYLLPSKKDKKDKKKSSGSDEAAVTESETDTKRAELLAKIRELMELGSLSKIPEADLGSSKRGVGLGNKTTGAAADEDVDMGEQSDGNGNVIGDDDFFGGDSDDE